MAAAPETAAEAAFDGEHRSEIALALAAVAKDRLAMIGTIILLAAILIAVAAPWISPYGPNEVVENARRLLPPFTPGFVLGTDGQGRDILSRIIWGGRVSIPIAAVPIVISSLAGLILGLLAGFAGGFLGGFIMRSLDVLFAFPGVLLSVAVATIMGSGMMNVTLAMSIVLLPWVARIVYVETVSILQMEFIEAARACRAGPVRILFREVMPNVISPVIVFGTTSLGAMIVFAAGLSFLGAGVQTADRRLGHHGLGRAQRPGHRPVGVDHPGHGHRDRGGGLQLCRRRPARRPSTRGSGPACSPLSRDRSCTRNPGGHGIACHRTWMRCSDSRT